MRIAAHCRLSARREREINKQVQPDGHEGSLINFRTNTANSLIEIIIF